MINKIDFQIVIVGFPAKTDCDCIGLLIFGTAKRL